LVRIICLSVLRILPLCTHPNPAIIKFCATVENRRQMIKPSKTRLNTAELPA